MKPLFLQIDFELINTDDTEQHLVETIISITSVLFEKVNNGEFSELFAADCDKRLNIYKHILSVYQILGKKTHE